MDLTKPFEIKDIASLHQQYIANTHRIFELQKKKDQGNITQKEAQELDETIAWNISFRQYLKKVE